MEKVILVEHLEKQFGDVTAVKDICFQVKKGELFGFLGVNGAGKSTTINMLCTHYKKTKGSIKVCGFDVEQKPEEVRRRIGVVFQNNTLDDLLTVEENLFLQGSLYEKSREKVKRQVMEAAQVLSIENLLKRRYSKLSGGQKRRCEIAKALMNAPEILFLDEPTTGLDPMTRKQVWESIARLQKEQNMTVFLTTHYMEEAAGAHYICIMDEGKIIAEGTPSVLKNRYARDVLRVYAKNPKEIWEMSLEGGRERFQSSNYVGFYLESTKDALPILAELEGKYDNFEVIQGNMDDVFLNVTGKKL